MRFFAAASSLAVQCSTQEDEEIHCVPIKDVPDLPVVPNLLWLVPLQLTRGLSFPLTVRQS